MAFSGNSREEEKGGSGTLVSGVEDVNRGSKSIDRCQQLFVRYLMLSGHCG